MKTLLIFFKWMKAVVILLLIYFLLFISFKKGREFGSFEIIAGLSIILWFVIGWLEEKIKKKYNSV